MSTSKGSNGTAQGGAVRLQPVGERITVALIPKAGQELTHLQKKTGLSKTDLVNRAITLYEFVDAQRRSGRDLLIRDESTGEMQTVLIL